MPGVGEGTARIRGRTLVVLMLVAVVIGVLFVWVAFRSLGSSSGTAQMTGSLLISDSGNPHGGDQTSFNVSLSAADGSGNLVLVPTLGTGLGLEARNFSVSGFSVSPSSVSMLLGGGSVKLVWTANDSVWNGEFNNYYIASWGPSASQEELKGSISPGAFPGVASTSYVELRLTGSPGNQTPSFLIAPKT